MIEYEFTLMFILPDSQDEPVQHLDALFDSGCDDAVVGTGTSGMISLEFNRDANSAANAIESAIHDVLRAIPAANLSLVEENQIWSNSPKSLIFSTDPCITLKSMR